MTVIRGKYGQWICSDIVDDVFDGFSFGPKLVDLHYYGYTKREAMRRFREHVKNFKLPNPA